MAHQQQREAADPQILMEQTWVKIQQRTFTRWCNTFLVDRMMKIDDLMVDFTDGVKLINLLEVISSKKFPVWNKKPRVKAQKLENCSFALKFLKNEGLRLVAIGPEDIVEPKKKLILGLIWTIILRYQIQRGESDGGSAKSELLKWVRSKIGPDTPWGYDIKNFKHDWLSGKEICALAEAVCPGQMDLPGDFSNVPIKDATMGFDSAEKNMGIPQVLYPEDMVGDHPDELSNMTYISYFRDWEENYGKRRAAELQEKTPVASQCRAFGPGLEGGEAGIPSDFTIEARNAMGNIIRAGGFPFSAKVSGPNGDVPIELTDNNDGTLSARYTPESKGPHTVEVLLSNDHIKDSPFNVNVDPARPDPSKCQMSGPGLKQGEVNAPAKFTVKAFNRLGAPINEGGAPFRVKVVGPYEGADPRDVTIKDNKDGTYDCEYTPTLHGPHSVAVELEDQLVANSPYKANIGRDPNRADPDKTYADGKGLTEPSTTEPNPIKIHAVKPDGSPMDKGGDLFDCEVLDPEGNVVPSKLKDNGDGTYDVEFETDVAGPHDVDLFLRNEDDPTFLEHVKGYPKKVNVEAGLDPSKTVCYGPGLEDGVRDGEPTHFMIETRDKNGNPLNEKGAGEAFDIAIDGPEGKIPATITDNDDGTYRVDYEPKGAGPTTIEVKNKDQQVADSPYKINVDPVIDASKTVAYGPGLEDGLRDGDDTYFTIETRDKHGNPLKDKGAGENFDVSVDGPEGKVPAKITDNGDGTYRVEYSPQGAGPHTIEAKNKDDQIADSPYKINVDPALDPSKTVAYGPGLEDGILDTQPTYFTIETRDKHGNPLKDKGVGENFDVSVDGPQGKVPAKITDNDDGTYRVDYEPQGAGPHTIEVKNKDKQVADSPYKIRVDPGAYAKNTFIEHFQFTVRTVDRTGKNKNVGGETDNFSVDISQGVKATVDDLGDGTYNVGYSLPKGKKGTWEIAVKLNGEDIQGSPFEHKNN